MVIDGIGELERGDVVGEEVVNIGRMWYVDMIWGNERG